MKQVLVSIFTIATLFASSAARADQVSAPLFQCALTFEAEGGGANLSVRGGSEALTMNLGVNVTKGLGLQVGVTQMKIEALD